MQLYIKDLESKWAVRNHKLCAMKRVHLVKGESREVEFTISKDAFEIVDESGKQYKDSNKFILFAGVSQPDPLSEQLTGVKCVSYSIEF